MNRNSQIPFTTYLKLILVIGIPFAVIMVMFDLAAGDSITFWKFLAHTILFGGMMTIFSIKVKKDRLAKFGITHLDNSLISLNQEATVQSTISFSDLLQLLKKQNFIKNIEVTEEGKCLSIKTRISSFSWGEKIEIKYDNREFENQISIHSKPLFPLSIMDGGRNIENIIKIKNLIKSFD